MEHRMKIQDSIDHIEKNLHERISLSDLAKRSYFSEFHFHRLFRKIAGVTVMEYVRKRRLEEAARELAESEDKITDIALMYQFGSEESFSRAFKRMYGVSPREYRSIKLKALKTDSLKGQAGRNPVCIAA